MHPAPLRARVVALAENQLGLRERTDRNDGEPAERYAGGRTGEPWCAHFVAWLFRHCGSPLPGDVEPSTTTPNPIALVSRMWVELERAKLRVWSPARGDIVVFRSRMDSDPDGSWHCGVVTDVDQHVRTIEGNSGHRVVRRLYSPRDKRIHGYARMPEPTPPGQE